MVLFLLSFLSIDKEIEEDTKYSCSVQAIYDRSGGDSFIISIVEVSDNLINICHSGEAILSISKITF